MSAWLRRDIARLVDKVPTRYRSEVPPERPDVGTCASSHGQVSEAVQSDRERARAGTVHGGAPTPSYGVDRAPRDLKACAAIDEPDQAEARRAAFKRVPPKPTAARGSFTYRTGTIRLVDRRLTGYFSASIAIAGFVVHLLSE